VRLDEPARLAEYLLQDQYGWTSERVKKAMMDELPQTIILKKPYRIQLEYRTAWVDEAGLINFREDIYGHDRRQMEWLQTNNKKGVVINPESGVAMEMP
jgi:murein L,D-transpeptidase YcbB/YkuD